VKKYRRQKWKYIGTKKWSQKIVWKYGDEKTNYRKSIEDKSKNIESKKWSQKIVWKYGDEKTNYRKSIEDKSEKVWYAKVKSVRR
jgi:hypothetical protein